jgi:hypothetical protein
VISIYLYVLSISLHYSYNLNFALYRLLRESIQWKKKYA